MITAAQPWMPFGEPQGAVSHRHRWFAVTCQAWRDSEGLSIGEIQQLKSSSLLWGIKGGKTGAAFVKVESWISKLLDFVEKSLEQQFTSLVRIKELEQSAGSILGRQRQGPSET